MHDCTQLHHAELRRVMAPHMSWNGVCDSGGGWWREVRFREMARVCTAPAVARSRLWWSWMQSRIMDTVSGGISPRWRGRERANPSSRFQPKMLSLFIFLPDREVSVPIGATGFDTLRKLEATHWTRWDTYVEVTTVGTEPDIHSHIRQGA